MLGVSGGVPTRAYSQSNDLLAPFPYRLFGRVAAEQGQLPQLPNAGQLILIYSFMQVNYIS